MKIHESWKKHFGPVLLVAVLALFFSATLANGQTLQDLPPPPPPPKPKPTPSPTPPPALKDEDFEVIRVTSNLVMVPVSVVDAKGQAVLGLPITDFRLEEQGREQQITELGNP
ncbi:MAG: hypothetical protein H0T64_12690, partial [Pyrinomonadaceae bacterium]|nr:hypothetical protein [Pyrinomonadaceae bacterium]